MTAAGGLPALYPWDDAETLIEHEIRQIEDALAALTREATAIEVVLGYDAERVIPLISRDNVEPIVVPTPGDASSAIRVGAAAVPRGTTSALLVDVRVPVSSAMYRSLFEAQMATKAPIVRGTASAMPIVVDGALLAALRNVTDDSGGLAALLERHRAETVAIELGAVVMIAGPADIAHARNRRG